MVHPSSQVSRFRSALVTGLGRRVLARIGLGLGLFAVLATLAFAGASHRIAAHRAVAPIAEAAARQLVLCERVSRLALGYAAATDPARRDGLGRALDVATAEMARTHRDLVRQGAPDEIRALYWSSGLEARLADFLGRSRAVLALPRRELGVGHPLVTAMLADADGPLLADLERASTHYEAISMAHVDGIAHLQLGLLLLTLALVVGEALVVFWPIVDQLVTRDRPGPSEPRPLGAQVSETPETAVG